MKLMIEKKTRKGSQLKTNNRILKIDLKAGATTFLIKRVDINN
jgi:hypothetical protein